MDKNMIHIDDLVRQRLGGGQEPERPGAWLTMRELLDKEMPVEAGVNWRRLLGYFTALLLLTSASVGGYRLYNQQQQEGIAGSVSGDKPLAIASVPSEGPGNAAAPVAVPAPHKPSAASGNNIAASPVHAQPAVRPMGQSGAALASSSVPSRRSHHTAAQQDAADNASRSDLQPAAALNGGMHQSPAAGPAAPVNNNPAASNIAGPIYASTAGAMARSQRTNAGLRALHANDIQVLNSASPAPASIAVARPVVAPVKMDTIERLQIVYRRMYDAGTQKPYYRIDTFPAGHFIVPRITPAPQEEAVAVETLQKRHGRHAATGRADSKSALAVKNTIPATPSGNSTTGALAQNVPASATAVEPAAKTENNLVSLSASKVSGKQFKLWNAEKIDAAINKFKFNLAKIQMYPGVMGGINASVLTNNSLGGFQVGLTSLFILNDWWSLMTEFKYIHRFNTGSTVRDDYMNVMNGTRSFTTVGGQSYKQYTWQDEHVEHYFNYDVVKTFELPLMLRYSWGRFYSQGGVNLVYSTKIDAKEVEHHRGDIMYHSELRPASHDDEDFIPNGAPLVRLSDFDSRFGTGYILSGGYMFSPAVYFDFRVAQTFWDNAKTGGATQISKDLLRTPSIQLSVGYRFSSPKH